MCCAVRDVPRILMTMWLGVVVGPMMTAMLMTTMMVMMMTIIIMIMMMLAMVVVMIKLVRLMGRELQLAPVGFPTDTKRAIAEAVRVATRWDARRSSAEPRQDMTTTGFLQYHTQNDWQQISDASTFEGKISVFVTRAARIGLVHPADNYLRKVCVCVCVSACVRVCARARCGV